MLCLVYILHHNPFVSFPQKDNSLVLPPRFYCWNVQRISFLLLPLKYQLCPIENGGGGNVKWMWRVCNRGNVQNVKFSTKELSTEIQILRS